MKKLASLALAGVMAVSLTACGSTEKAAVKETTAAAAKTEAAKETKAEETKAEEAGAAKAESSIAQITGPVEIQFWHSISNPVHAEVLENLVNEFNETVGKEKQITVVPTFNGSGADLYSSVIASLKSGNAPDVTLALRPYVADYLQTDYVVDLAPYIQDETVGIKDYEDIFQGLREGGENYAKEGIYSLPIHSYSEVLYINKDFFEKNQLTVPTTWDELNETSKKIYEITGKPAFGWDNLAGSFMTLLQQNGGCYTDQDGHIYFAQEDEETTLKVLNMWKENVEQGIWRTAGEDMFFSGPFANEQIPMYVGDSVEASYIPNKNPNLNWTTAPVPQVGEDTAANLSAGHVIIALNTTGDAQKEYASYEFIKFMTSTEANKDVVVAGTGYLPIRQSVADSEEYKNYVADGHDYLTAAVEQSGYYFYEPVFTNDTTTSSAVNSAVKIMMQEVAENGEAPETALAHLKQTVGLN